MLCELSSYGLLFHKANLPSVLSWLPDRSLPSSYQWGGTTKQKREQLVTGTAQQLISYFLTDLQGADGAEKTGKIKKKTQNTTSKQHPCCYNTPISYLTAGF